MTKNDRGDIVSINKIRPTINSVLGDDFFEDFNKSSKGRPSIVKSKTVRGKKQSIIEIRPTLVGNQYY